VTSQPDILVGGQLKDYQIKGLQWLISLFNNSLNGILADEMGLGKTIQTISLVTHLMEKKNVNGPFLVVAPLSTVPNWKMEFEKWAPSVIKVVYKGQPLVRRELYQNIIQTGKFNVVITTYEYIIKDKNMLSRVNWKYIIVDEGHRMKNRNCKLSTILASSYKSKHRLLLTGTPLQNSLPELWSLLNFLLPHIFNSVENFEQWFNAPFSSSGEQVELNEEETLLVINRLHSVLRPFLLRRLKVEVEDQLPDKVEKVLKCELSAMQRRMYTAMQEHGVTFTSTCNNGKGGSVRGLMNTLMQLRKICNHPYLFNAEMDWNIDDDLVRASGKFALMDRILPKLKASGHRVLIFSQMTQLMDIMGDYFQYRNFKYLRLDGSTKADDRSSLLEQFNAPNSEIFIFMLSTRAGGLGLNLQTADTVILFDSDWNPQMDLQAQDRAHRIGQKQEVRVFRLVSLNSIEEKILATAMWKLNIDAKIIQAGMFNNQSNAEERKEFLENLLKDENHDESLDEAPSDKQINRMIARSDEEYDFFQKMDKVEEVEARKRARVLGYRKERLMTEDELPDWMNEELITRNKNSDITYGRGFRDRGNVQYDDHMTEHQWTKMIESKIDESGEKKRSKRRRDTNSNAEAIDKKKRGRKRHLERQPDSDSSTSKKRGRKSAVDTGKLYTMLWSVYQEVYDNVDEDGRERSAIFDQLPSKIEYPDYYDVIAKPICLNDIKRKLKRSAYTTKQEFIDDFDLLYQNAKLYNVPESLVAMDADQLQKLVHERMDSFEDGAEADDAASQSEKEADSAPQKKARVVVIGSDAASGDSSEKEEEPKRKRKLKLKITLPKNSNE